jgi:molecular chaperone DnaK (HSP70)
VSAVACVGQDPWLGGGEDLDNVLFEYFANGFQEKYKLGDS